jgi:hypothetical protein
MVSVRDITKKRWVSVNGAGRRIGESHHGAVLSDHEVGLVHELYELGMSLAEIARKMEVTKGCIWKIVHGYRRGQIPAGWVRVRKHS